MATKYLELFQALASYNDERSDNVLTFDAGAFLSLLPPPSFSLPCCCFELLGSSLKEHPTHTERGGPELQVNSQMCLWKGRELRW